MRIFVTGAAGRVGRRVARELLNHGHALRLWERAPVEAELRERCEVVYGELTDRLALLNALAGCDAVAHLGAVPDPRNGKELDLMAPNVLGTQYLLSAAEAHGIQRVVFASSLCIYGLPFQKSDTLDPLYLPMDEAHPQRPEDLYALSKAFGEQLLHTFSRRSAMTTIALRLTWVTHFDVANTWMERHLRRAHEHKSHDLWGYVEVEDAARAFRLALEKDGVSGHHALHIAASDLLGPTPARARIERHFPQLLPFLDGEFPFDERGFWDTRRAQEIIGWESQRHWRDFWTLDAPK